MACGFGFIGFLDDYIKVVKKRNLGLNVRQKLVLQFLVAGAYLYSLYHAGSGSRMLVPFAGSVDWGVWYWVVSLLGIVGDGERRQLYGRHRRAECFRHFFRLPHFPDDCGSF